MTNKIARKYLLKANRKAKKAFQKEVNSLIRTFNSDIKKASKRGVNIFRIKIREVELYEKVRLHYISKGFRCWITHDDDFNYLCIAW